MILRSWAGLARIMGVARDRFPTAGRLSSIVPPSAFDGTPADFFNPGTEPSNQTCSADLAFRKNRRLECFRPFRLPMSSRRLTHQMVSELAGNFSSDRMSNYFEHQEVPAR